MDKWWILEAEKLDEIREMGVQNFKFSKNPKILVKSAKVELTTSYSQLDTIGHITD